MGNIPIVKIEEGRKEQHPNCSSELLLAQMVLEHSPIVVMRFSYDGSIVFVNTMGCKAFELNKEDIIGRKFWDLNKEISEERWYEYWDNIKLEKCSTHKLILSVAATQECYYELSASYIEFEGHEYLIGYGRDITKEKKIGTIVKKQQESMEIVLDSMPGIAFFKDNQFRYVMCNRAFCEAAGYTYEELKGKTDFELFPYEIADKYYRNDVLIFSSCGIQELEEDSIYQGKAIRMLTRKVPILDDDGKAIGLVGLGFDITQIKELERSLAQEYDMKQAMIAALSLGVHVYRIDTGECMLVNEGAARILNTTVEEFRKQNLYQIDLWKKDGLLEVALAVMQEGLEKSIEKYVITSFGRELWLKCTFVPFKSGGEPYLVLLTEDISERKNMEEDLSSAMEAKSQFLANMSHEIRTPVSSIIGMAQLLADMQMTEEQRECLAMISSSSESLLAIINDILDFSKIEAGKMILEQVDFNLQKVLKNIIEIMGIKAAEKKIIIKLILPSNVPEMIKGDPIRLGQVIINLVHNAIKFTESGAVILRIAVRHQQEDRLLLYFEVIDTGIGIEKEKQKNLFGTFTQADSSTTRRFGGSGLGLVISKRLVEMMGGTIGMESEFQHGSIFWFTMPTQVGNIQDIVEEKSNLWDAMGNREALKTSKPILVAEDTIELQKVITMQLKKLGINHDIVSDGLAAIEVYGQKEYSMILMDCHMPNMDGYEATRIIREKEATTGRHIPIIALTADAMSGTKEKCLQAGMDDYLSKPVDIEKFIISLRKWLQLEDRSMSFKGADNITKKIIGNSDNNTINMNKIMEIETLADHNVDFMRELISDYLEHGRVRFLELQQAVVDGNIDAIKELAHQMGTPSLYLGAEQLGGLFRVIEEYANNQEVDKIAYSMKEVAEKWDTATQKLKEVAESYSAQKKAHNIDI